MTKQQLIAAARAARGTLLATIQNNNDVNYIRITKAAVYELVAPYADDYETGYEISETNGEWFLDRDYN
jgi:hypothetical protein